MTYFFGGGEEEPERGRAARARALAARRADLRPQAGDERARGRRRRSCSAWRRSDFRFGIINFANADMVGHTGVIPAAVKAVETVDACLGEVVEAVQALGRRAAHHRRPRQRRRDARGRRLAEHRALAQPGAPHRHRRRRALRDGGRPGRRRADDARAARHRAARGDDRPLAARRTPVADAPDDALDRLYGLPREAFVAERDALAKELRADGKPRRGGGGQGPAKPTVSAWAVNQAVRSQQARRGSCGSRATPSRPSRMSSPARDRARTCERRRTSATRSRPSSTPPVG